MFKHSILALSILITGNITGQTDKMIICNYELDVSDPNNITDNFLPYGSTQTILTKYPVEFGGSTTEAERFVYTGESARHSQNIWYDSNGQVKFFVIDGNIYNHQGLLLFGGRLNDELSDSDIYLGEYLYEGHSECIITEVPGKCNSFYVITGTVDENNAGYFIGNNNSNNSFPPPIPKIDLSVVEIDFNEDNYYYKNSSDPSLVVKGKTMNFHTFEASEPVNYPNDGSFSDNLGYEDLHLAVNTKDKSHPFLYITTGRHFNVVEIPPSGGGSFLVSYSHSIDLFGYANVPIRAELDVSDYDNGNSIVAAPITLSYDFTTPGGVSIGVSYEAVELREVGSTILDHYFDATSGLGRRWLYLSFYGVLEPPYDPNNPFYTISGLEFSENGQYLFVVTREAPYLWYADVSSTNIPLNTANANNTNGTNVLNLLPVNLIPPVSTSNFKGSQLEKVANGDMIMKVDDGTLIRLEQPTTQLPLINRSVISTTTFSGCDPSEGPELLVDNYNDRCYLNLLIDQHDDEYINDLIDDANVCCSDEIVYDIFNPIISSNTNWTNNNNPGSGNGEIYISGDLIVEENVLFNLTDVTLKFSHDSKFIVKRGGRVKLSNTELTSVECTEIMWGGVELWGTQGIAHNGFVNQNYAWLNMYNNSTISNAYNGITTGKRLSGNNNYDISHSGGLVTCNNSNFINNERDVDMPPFLTQIFGFNFNAMNWSYFNRNEFLTTSALKDPNTFPRGHVRLVQNNGVDFRANLFEYQAGNAYYLTQQKGTGIQAFDSYFQATYACNSTNYPGPACPEVDRAGNIFRNLHYGINSIAANPIHSCDIEFNEFDANYRGIRLVGITAPIIDNNTFNVGTLPSSLPAPTQNYGAYLENCTKYKFENNRFNDAYGSKWGLVVTNSGEMNNWVYNNSFYDMKYATTASLLNRSLSGVNKGLQIDCNYYRLSTEVDIQVPNSTGSVVGIKKDQGSCSGLDVTAPANNIFTLPYPVNGHFTLDPSVQPVEYHYPEFSVAGWVNPLNPIIPGLYTEEECINVTFNVTDGCPVNIFKPLSNVQVVDIITLSKKSISDLNDQIDGGNTGALLSNIANSNGGALKNILISHSPYLSDEVLKAYILSAPSPGHLLQVIQANSPVSEEIMNLLNNTPMPNGIRNQIAAAQDGGDSPMDILQSDISSITFEKDMAFDELFRRVLHDTTDFNMGDSLRSILNLDLYKENEKAKVECYLAEGDYSNAQQELNTYISNYNNELDYQKLINQLITIYSCNDKAYRLTWDNVTEQNLTDVALSGEKQECKNAIALLELLGYLNKPELLEVLSPGANKIEMVSNHDVKQKFDFTVYPVPASDHVNVQFDNIIESGVLSIFNISGKEVFKSNIINSDYVLIETNHLSNGLYLIKMQSIGKELSGRFIVNH